MTQNLKHDFSGFATAYEVKCTDGRTIGSGSFDHQDGTRVPLVWRHMHDSMDNVVGHGILKKHPKGMRIEQAKFNKTKSGQQAKTLVLDGDIDSLSVWANNIKEESLRVVHGFIREVSLVLSGANPGAKIDTVIVHSSDSTLDGEDFEEGIIIHSGIPIELFTEEELDSEDVEHAENDPTIKEVLESMTDEQKGLVGVLVQSAITDDKLSGNTDSSDGPIIEDILNSMSDIQKNVLYYMVGLASEDDAEIQQSDEEGNQMTQHNIFEQKQDGNKVLSHEQQRGIIADAMRSKAPSLKDVVVQHAGTYGIDNIDVLFPEAVNVNGNEPQWYSREQTWVPLVMNAIRKTPFSRIKSAYADINADEARARGYITGAEKFEEVFPLFARTTTPQTIYKKQKLDRDDIIDITGFDVVMWLKKEMRMMLLEEIARAVLISDGRANVSPDKINVTNVRPIYTDDDLYSHKILFETTDDVLDIIDGITAAREHYKGSGNPTLYLAPGILSSMLLLRGTTDERRLYETEASLKAALRVSNIVEVPLMAGVSRDGDTNVQNLVAILVNLNDYVIGADKGGETTFFDDFDLDFNQYRYLLETRISGALIRPKSAIVFEQDTGTPI